MLDFIDRFGGEGPRSRPEIDLGGAAGLLRVMRLAAFLERELAASCAVKPGQFQVLTAVLDRLEEEGLIRRAIDSEDRRTRRITITEKGRSLIDRALGQRMAQHRALNAVLTLEEREALSDILRKLLIAVEGEAA